MASLAALSLAAIALVQAGPMGRLDVDPLLTQQAHGRPGFLQTSAKNNRRLSAAIGESVHKTQREGVPIWREYDQFRRHFFVNTETGERQWTKPSSVFEVLPSNAATLMRHATHPETFVRQDLIESSKVFETRPYHQMEHKSNQSDITLAFQGDLRRLPQLRKIAQVWRGPISASLLVLESDIPHVDEMINSSKSIRKHVNLNLCVAPKQWEYYPVNTMRNHANQHARTDYLFILDGDEDPVQNMWAFKHDLKNALDSTHADPSQTAFIVSSWQWGNTTLPDLDYPRSKADLSRLAKAGKAVCKAADFPQAYAPLGVDLDKEWMGKHNATEVPWHDRYEPYMVVHKDTVGTFDERFVGWGGNKAIHILKMQLAKIKFVLLPGVFTFTNESIVEDNAKEHSLPADPDLPERAAVELGLNMGCNICNYKQCVMNCLGGLDVKDYV